MKSRVTHYRRNDRGELVFVGYEYHDIPDRPSPRRAGLVERLRQERECRVAAAVRDDFEALVDAACESY